MSVQSAGSDLVQGGSGDEATHTRNHLRWLVGWERGRCPGQGLPSPPPPESSGQGPWGS